MEELDLQLRAHAIFAEILSFWHSIHVRQLTTLASLATIIQLHQEILGTAIIQKISPPPIHTHLHIQT